MTTDVKITASVKSDKIENETKKLEKTITANEPAKLEQNFNHLSMEVSQDNWCQENKENKEHQKSNKNPNYKGKNYKQGYKKNYYNQYLWDGNQGYGQYHANNNYYYYNRDQNKTGYENKSYVQPRYYQNKTHQSFQKPPEETSFIHKFIPNQTNPNKNRENGQGPYRVPKNYQRSVDLALVPELENSEPEQKRKLFIGGLSYETDDKSLFEHFSKYGGLTDCVVMKDPRTKRSRGFGFVCFAKSDDLETCMADRPHEIHKRPVEPKRAVSRLESAKPGANLSAYKLWISGFDPEKIGADDFREYFSKYGTINSIDLPKNKETGESRNFAFVIFDDYDVVDRIIADSKKRIQERRQKPELDSKAGSEKSTESTEKEETTKDPEDQSAEITIPDLQSNDDIDAVINNMHPIQFKQTNLVHEHIIKGFTIIVNKGFTSDEMKEIKTNLIKKQAAQDRNKTRYQNQMAYQYNYNYMNNYKHAPAMLEKHDKMTNKSKSSSGNSTQNTTPDKQRGKTHAGFVKTTPPNVPQCRLVGSHVTHNPPHLNKDGSAKGSASPTSNEYQYYGNDSNGHQYFYHHYYYGNYTAVYPDGTQTTGYNYQGKNSDTASTTTQAYQVPTYPQTYNYQQTYLPEQVNPSPGLFIPGATHYFGENNYYQSSKTNNNRHKNRNFQKYKNNFKTEAKPVSDEAKTSSSEIAAAE